MKHYKPMLAETAKAPFDSTDWIYEVKWDGIRAISYINGEISIRSRNDKELKHNFPELQELKDLVENVVIDGEIILMKNGKTDFQTLLERSKTGLPRQIEHMVNTSPATYVVFDLLEKDGTTLTDLPLTERKKLLSEVLKDGKHVVRSIFVEEHGIAYYEEALKTGVEGIMAKKKGSSYQSGTRSSNWLKIKRLKTCDCVIFGYTEGTGKRRRTFGALILGLYDKGIPVFVGKVGTAFTEEDLEKLKQAFLPLETKEKTLNNVDVPEEVTWTKPTIVSEIMYQTVTKDGRLRMPRFLGLRTDKMPTECALDQIRQISLQEYVSKRDFSVTTEPQGEAKLIDGKSFVVQEHHARRLHFDLRLEREGVLKSWAVPEGIPTAQGDKRLAVQTEDHPIEYARFQGTIPKGHYGAGTVRIWDDGTYETKTWEKSKVEFALNGKRFHGKYLLTKLKKTDKDQWLLIKVRD